MVVVVGDIYKACVEGSQSVSNLVSIVVVIVVMGGYI